MTDVAEAARTPRAEQTRAAITEAALALFRERGYEAATMRAIAQRAGVSTGSAYYYFSSKEEPYHSFAATFYKHAAEPASPLSPFSPQSSPARTASIALYREVIEGSTARMGPGVRERLPELLWLYSLGITLFWVHDQSAGCRRTYGLIDATVPVIAQLVAASRLPALRRTLRDLITVVDQLSP